MKRSPFAEMLMYRAEEINTMSTGEDEASPRNGRLRPRKSTSTYTSSPQIKTVRRTEHKQATDRLKRSSTSSKTSPSKQDDLVTKSDTAPAPLFLCPYCDRKFNARQTASKHARRIHLSTTKQDNFIKCLYCNHSDAESNAIIKHMVDSHPNQYFACLDCHTRFLSTTELAEHKLNVCEKQKLPYRNKLRQKSSARIKKNSKKTAKKEGTEESNKNTEYTEDLSFNGIVISCELKPSDTHDAADIEDKITTNLILPSAKTSLGNTGMDKNAVIVLDDLQWNKRIPSNFSFHNTDADQILSRLGVVHRSPRVGESRKDLIRMMDEPNEKFEKCFDTSFYSKVAKNVQDNLAKYLDGTFNFNPNKDFTIKTRKSKASVLINTAEGFPILLAQEQFSRHLFDGFMPRAIAPKHKWKWDSTENDKSLMMLFDQTKRDSHVNNCIITLISSLDIWTQLRMKSKFEEIFKTTPTAKKTEKQNIIGMELKEILESRDIPSRSSQVVQVKRKPVNADAGLELPEYLGLSATRSECELQPAVLSGEWVRPRCYVCCACGEQTRDARTLSAHLSTQHPNAQVQHYEIVGETLLSADILKHLYVPPSQMSNRTRPPRGFRDCTKCKKSVTLEDLHQHMLDCAGDTPAVRRKCRYRPFGVRRRRPRLPDNTIRKKMRKDIRARHRQKSHMRPRPRIRTEVGDAETIRKMIADLPAKRNRITPTNVLRPRRTILKAKKQVKLRAAEDKKQRPVKSLHKPNKGTATTEVEKKQNDTDNSSTLDEDDQPLKQSATRVSTRSSNGKEALRRRVTINKNKKKKPSAKKKPNMEWCPPHYNNYVMPAGSMMGNLLNPHVYHQTSLGHVVLPLYNMPSRNNVFRPEAIRPDVYPSPYHPYYFHNQPRVDIEPHHQQVVREMRRRKVRGVNRAQYSNQPVIEYSNERIDVTSAGPSYMRQHSGRNDNNIQNSKDYSISGGESSHQNKNVAQVPNVPLKHSIASLTSDTDNRDSSTPYHRPSVLSSEENNSFLRESSERKEFENEATVEEVDKPPLSNNSMQSQPSPEQQSAPNNFKGGHDCSLSLSYTYGTHEDPSQNKPIELQQATPEQQPAPNTFKGRHDSSLGPSYSYGTLEDPLQNKPIELQATPEQQPASNTFKGRHDSSLGPSYSDGTLEDPLQNEPIELQTSTGQMLLSKNSTALDESNQIDMPQSPLINESKVSREPIGDSLLPRNSKELEVHKMMETKMETSKSNSIKTRKGLKIESCIAMIRTKKGLRLDKTVSELDKHKNSGSEIKNTDRETTQAPVSPRSDLPLTATTTAQKSNDTVNFDATAGLKEQCPEENICKTKSDILSIDQPLLQTEDVLLQTKSSTSAQRSEDVSSNPILHKAKPELSITRLTRHLNSEITKMSKLDQGSPIEPSNTSQSYNEYESNMSKLSDFWHTRSDKTQELMLREQFLTYTVNQTIQLLKDLDLPGLTEGMIRMQDKLIEGKEKLDMEVLYKYSFFILRQTYSPLPDGNVLSRYINKACDAPSELAVTKTVNPVALQSVSHSTHNTENFTEEKIQSRQTNDSPTSRRTRRKPIKKKTSPEQELEFFQKQSKVSLHPNPQRVLASPLDSNTSNLFSTSYVAPTPPASEMCSLKTPPPPPPYSSHIRRDSCKRIVNNSENSANFSEIKEVTRTSPSDFRAETIQQQLMNNLRRQSIELANAQTNTNNYNDFAAQTYRMEYEKAMGMSHLGGELSHVHKIGPDNNDNPCYNHSSDLLMNQYPVPKLSPMDKDMTVKSIAGCKHQLNKYNSREKRGNYKPSQESMNQLRSNNFDSNEDKILKSHDRVNKNIARQETKTAAQMCNPLDIDSRRTPPPRRSSEAYPHSTVCQTSISNTFRKSDCTIDSGSNENTKHPDMSSRIYHEPVIPFAPPSASRPKPSLSHEPHIGEETPLDLSCVSRKGKLLDASLEASDLSINLCINKEKQNENMTVKPNFRSNLEPLQDHSQNTALLKCTPEFERVDEYTHQQAPVLLLENAKTHQSSELIVKNHQEMLKHYSEFPPTAIAQAANTDNMDLLGKSTNILSHQRFYNYDINKIASTGNNNSGLPNQTVFLPTEDSYSVSSEAQIANNKVTNVLESSKEKSFIETNNIAQPTVKFDNTILPKHLNTIPSSNINPQLENTNPRDSQLNVSCHLPSEEVPASIAKNPKHESTNKTSGQVTNQKLLGDNDNNQIEQDAETARKIAMLPEELVKVLGTIPKDHRNQLLNILPQYVSAPVSNIENDAKNALSIASSLKNNVPQQETKDNTTVINESNNKLTVDTVFSPSSVIPKKRHSPSHSRGRLDSSETQMTVSLLPPSLVPTISQRSPIAHSEFGNSGTVTRNSLETNSESANKDFNKHPNLKINTEVTDLAELSLSPAPLASPLSKAKISTKQKSCNEQTASLRAVRIKTTSARKSFSDDKKLLVNYGYKTNTSIDEMSTIPTTITTLSQEYNANSYYDIKYDDDNLHNKQINSDQLLREIVNQEISCNQTHDGIIKTKNDTMKQRDHIMKLVTQEENNVILLDNIQENTSRNIITQSVVAVDLKDGTSSGDINYFKQVSESLDDRFREIEMSVVKPLTTSSNNEIEEKNEKLIRNQVQSSCENNNETNVVEARSKELELTNNSSECNADNTADDSNTKIDTNISESSGPNFAKMLDVKLTIVSKEKLDNSFVMGPQFVNDNESRLENEKLNDDSDDDVTLAVIKQKHCSLPVVDKTELCGMNITIKQSKEKNKQNKNQQKKITNRNKKKFETMHYTSPDDVSSYNNITENSDNNIFIPNDSEVKDDIITKVDDTPATTDLECVKVHSYDVNKENTAIKNTNVVKENDDCLSLIPEHNEINFTRENSLDTNISDEYKNATVAKPEDIQNISSIVNTAKSCTVENEQNQKSDISDSGNNFNMFSSLMKNSMQDDERLNELSEGSVRETETTTSTDTLNNTNDFQVNSETCEVNVLSLRRSRRGKSMYVDRCHLEKQEKIEDHAQKAPLTMKRLILSRVEKDKKRNSESSNVEKNTEVTEDEELIPSEESKSEAVKKGKYTKRKKSPQSKKSSKKTKPSNVCELDEDYSDTSNVPSENNSFILRELPNAENKISDNESSIDEVKCHTIAENTTVVSSEKDPEEVNDSLVEVKESSTSGKRKLNVINVSDSDSAKSKKTKYHKKKSQSDFDSDDDKVLLETKQCSINESDEKHTIIGQDSNSDILREEDVTAGSTKYVNETIVDRQEKNYVLEQITSASIPAETRITCYSRSISNRRPRSTSYTLKDHANYDPYDIDFEDMLETAKPITKKKSKNSQSTKSLLDHKVVKYEDFNSIDTKVSKKAISKTVSHESDSDSSKSDVPLQKYVEEKALELGLKNKSGNCSFDDNNEKVIEKVSTEKVLDTEQIINITEYTESNKDATTKDITNEISSALKNTKSTKRETVVKTSKTEINAKNESVLSVDQNKQKQPSKQKRSRRPPTISNVNSVTGSDEIDQQLRSDKFMENFGFYSERIPRKSNLLASKKISETFHMISNESDDCFSSYKEKTSRKSPSENKKKSDGSCNIVTSEELKTVTSVETTAESKTLTSEDTMGGQSIRSKTDIEETFIVNEPDDAQRMDDSDLDSLAAQAIMDSEEVRNLENDLFLGLREAAEANAARNCFVSHQIIGDLDVTAKHVDQNDTVLQTEESCHPVEQITESTKKTGKKKQIKQPGVKSKMYPDIEEIDMFEDKFDKIKRKRRSQAVAAKQQITVETNTSSKSRKQSDKKRIAKNSKKNHQSGNVLTKGALKGFECIKISIPTQDLNLTLNVSPSRQSKKRRKTTTKRKELSNSGSSGSEFDEGNKYVSEKDIYEFKDSEDTELFVLRPSTVMDRFRSMHNKNKSKYKEKDKAKDTEKERLKSREKQRKDKEFTSSDSKVEQKKTSENTKSPRKGYLGEERFTEKDDESVSNYGEKNSKVEKGLNDSLLLEASKTEDTCAIIQKSSLCDKSRYHDDGSEKKDLDNAVPGTSGFVPDRMDESDYESEMSSPEGDFIFYTSNDVNCACPSENESDDSDVDRGCGRLNCLNKNKNADKNAAIGNIFKNNAVRCEKPEIKEPEIPKPDLDQLFDSLLETESKSNNDKIENNDLGLEPPSEFVVRGKTPITPERRHDLIKRHKEDQTSVLKNDIVCHLDESFNTKNLDHPIPSNRRYESKNSKVDEHTPSKTHYTSLLSNNDNLSDSDSIQIFSISDKSKENLGYSLMSEECTQVNLADIIADANNKAIDKQSKTGSTNQLVKCNSEDEFDIDKPESLNRQYMHLVLPAEKASTCAQTDSKTEDSDESCNESAATKYLKGLTPSEAANMEIYTMVSAQGTQTDKSSRRDSGTSKQSDNISLKSEDELDIRLIPRSRIRLQKYDVREIAQKTKSSKCIQTEKNKASFDYDNQSDSDEEILHYRDRTSKKNDLCKGSVKSNSVKRHVIDEENVTFPLDDINAFTAPASKSAKEKHSPRKSDEGISTSHDHSADAFDQSLPDDTGVARQRARRKCTVGKQNVLAEHWSSESEFDGGPARPNSADSIVASAPRKKKSRKREGHHGGGRKVGRHSSKSGGRSRGGASDESDAGASGTAARAHPGPKIRARAAHHYWSSEGEETVGPQPQHGWIVGNSHKKLVTMLAHAKGRKRHHADKHLD